MKTPFPVRSPLGLIRIGLATGLGLGCANALADTPPLTLDDPAPQAYANFGAALAGVGDVDGDGVADLLVGAPNQGAGRAFVFSGSDGAVIRALDDPTTQASSNFGAAVADAGDLNGDGVSDQAVGAYFQTVGANAGQGQVFLFSGADGGLLRTLDDPTPQAYANFGAAVAGIGDVDGDGVADLVVGARYQAPGGNTAQGQAFVFSGADGGLLLTLDDPVPQASANFGYALAGVGDVDADGTPDLLVGAPYQGQGEAFVFSGSDGTLLHTLDTPTPLVLSGLGFAVAGTGDVDHDGVADLLAGAPYQDVGAHPMQGQALVFSGADGGLLLTLDDPTPQDYANFGSAVAGIGDLDGDGTPDLAVAAPYQTVGGVLYKGQVSVFSGAGGGLLQTLDDPTTAQSFGGFFGNAIAAVGDPQPGRDAGAAGGGALPIRRRQLQPGPGLPLLRRRWRGRHPGRGRRRAWRQRQQLQLRQQRGSAGRHPEWPRFRRDRRGHRQRLTERPGRKRRRARHGG